MVLLLPFLDQQCPHHRISLFSFPLSWTLQLRDYESPRHRLAPHSSLIVPFYPSRSKKPPFSGWSLRISLSVTPLVSFLSMDLCVSSIWACVCLCLSHSFLLYVESPETERPHLSASYTLDKWKDWNHQARWPATVRIRYYRPHYQIHHLRNRIATGIIFMMMVIRDTAVVVLIIKMLAQQRHSISTLH